MSDSTDERVYELWRDAAYFDDQPVYLGTFDTEEAAVEERQKSAEFADLLGSDYIIREVSARFDLREGVLEL